MKNTFIVVLMVLLISNAYGQDCDPFTSSTEIIHGKLKHTLLVSEEGLLNPLHIKTRIGLDGDLDTRTYAPLVYSSCLWAGGLDPSGNIKLAAGGYNDQDWRPGPLSISGVTNSSTCNEWNRIWNVSKKDVLTARNIFLDGGLCDAMPESILNWPGRNNSNLSFLPADRAFGGFWDENGDGNYQPCEGDFPLLEIDGCEGFNAESFLNNMPSEISFYVMNDNGAAHAVTNATPIQLEVHVTSFIYKTQETEGMVFFKHKLFNRASEDIRQMIFGQWLDFDLGCNSNDNLGSDEDRQMIYAYNESSEVDCGENSLEEKNLAVGFTYLIGPRAPFVIVEGSDGQDSLVYPPIGSGDFDILAELMASRAMIPNQCLDPTQPANCNPQSPSDFYNLLNGKNFDGSFPLDNNGVSTSFMFPGNPANEDEWSLCTDESGAETTGILSIDNILLQPQATNEILYAIYYTDVMDSDCPDDAAIKYKDDLVQRLYNNCFEHYDGPPSPQLQVVYSDEGVDLQLSAIPTQYSESIKEASSDLHDDLYYNFEGIKVYQVASRNFDMDELENPELSKLVYQGDLENDITQISNYKVEFEGAVRNWSPKLKVEGSNEGIQTQFSLAYDFIRDKPIDIADELFYVVVSYGFNNYEDFNPTGIIDTSGNFIATGQQYNYIETTCGLEVEEAVISVSQTKSPYELGLYDYIFSDNIMHLFNLEEDLTMQLYSIDGKSLEHWNVKKGMSYSSGNLSDKLSSGLYLLQVRAAFSQSIGYHKVMVVR